MALTNVFKSVSKESLIKDVVETMNEVIKQDICSSSRHGLIISFMKPNVLRIVYIYTINTESYMPYYSMKFHDKGVNTLINFQHFNTKDLSFSTMEEYINIMNLGNFVRRSHKEIQLLVSEEVNSILNKLNILV